MNKSIRIIAVAAVMFAVMGLGISAIAADTDTFTITVTVKYTAVTLVEDSDGVTAYTDWAIGAGNPVSLGSVAAMGNDEGVQTKVVTNVDYDIECWVVEKATSGANWEVAPSADTNKFKLEAKTNTTKSTYAASVAGPVVLTTATQDLASGITAATADYFLYYQFTAPTSVDSLANASGGNITVTVKVSPNA